MAATRELAEKLPAALVLDADGEHQARPVKQPAGGGQRMSRSVEGSLVRVELEYAGKAACSGWFNVAAWQVDDRWDPTAARAPDPAPSASTASS